MVGFLIRTWNAVWPNLLASLLWAPVTLVHISKSNRKTLKVWLGDKPGDDSEEGP